MRYLNSVEMCNYITKSLLKEDSRSPVPVTKIPELMAAMMSLKGLVAEDQITDPLMTARFNDLMSAMLAVNNNKVGMTNITETMKQELLNGVNAIKSTVCVKAFNYYEENDFEPTPEVVPLMIDVVETAALAGLLN